MTKTALLLAAVAASACSASSAALHESSGDERALGTVRWDIQDRSRSDGQVQLSFRSGDNGRNQNNWSSGYSLAELQGLSAAQLNGGSGPVRFALVREPGRLDCGGTAGGGRGNGTCTFTAAPAFVQRLVANGIGQPSERQSFSLTLGNVRGELVDELTRQGYRKPTIGNLVAMGIHGVTPAYVRDLAAAGYKLGDPEGLVKFRIFNIDAAYIGALAATGPQFRTLSSDDLVKFKIHGVKPELVRAYQSLGYASLDADDLVSMAIHGVSPQYVTELASLGYRGIPARQLVTMRIHGVTPAYIRELKNGGMALPSPEQLVRLRLAGYRPR